MRFIAILSLIVASVSAAAINSRSGDPMTQEDAQLLLEAFGIYASSSGNCTDRYNPECTSYEGILTGTVAGVIALAMTSECPASDVVITGGTEVGHAPGEYSHENGYMVNLRKTSCLNKYIGTFEPSGPCQKDLFGNPYCDSDNGWDVTYYY